MNHVHSPKAFQAISPSRTSLVGRFLTSLKQTWQAQEDPPIHIGSALEDPAPEPLWKVTGTLTCLTSFGRLTAESRHRIHAATREEALAEARARMLAAHPDFIISSLAAARTDGD